MSKELMDSLMCNNIEEFKNLIKKSNKEEKEKIYFTSIKLGKIEYVEEILNNDIDININDINGNNGLINAVENNNYNLVKLLLKKGILKEVENKYGLTGLKLALFKCHLKLIDEILLLSDSDDYSMKEILKNDIDIFLESSVKGISVLEEYLFKKGVNTKELNLNSIKKNLKMIKLLM